MSSSAGRKLRIAFIAQPFDRMTPPVLGGSLSMWIYEAARLCAKRGHTAIVLGNHGGLLSGQTAEHDGVNYIFTPTGIDRMLNRLGERFHKNGKAGLPSFACSWHHGGYARAAARRTRELDCDVVHIMNYTQFVPHVREVNPNCKISLHMQCEWLTQLDRQAMAQRLSEADLMVGCSEHITRLTAAAYPELANRCVTVPNAAYTIPEYDRSAANSLAVLFVGRLSPEKGIHDLIEAFHLVLQKIPEARLHIVGGAGAAPFEYLVGLSDDPKVQALRRFYERPSSGTDAYFDALQKEAGVELGKRIIFEGRASHDEIDSFYQRVGLLVNPSLSESFGISLVEAMMHKIPVVATKVGGMAYTVIPNETGYLVEGADPDALADAICRVLQNPENARKMGEAGRQRALRNFSWENSADTLLRHYTKLAA
jgi:glycosyltransferase involved in cell wall biosynthesis